MTAPAPWDADRPPLDAASVERIVGAAFPELRGLAARKIGQGWNNEAWELGGTWVFRFPKQAGAVPSLRMETRLLPQLEGVLPIAIPRFEFLGEPCAEFPHAYVGYREIVGALAFDVDAAAVDVAQVDVASVGRDLGRALSALHAFSTDRALEAGVRSTSPGGFERARADALGEMAAVRDAAGDELAEAVARTIREMTPFPPARHPVLLHADLFPEHIVLDTELRSVVGVLDWADARVGDVEADFAGLFTWLGEPLVEATLAHYSGPVDDDLLRRARSGAMFGAVQDVQFGLGTGEPRFVRRGVDCLRRALATRG